MIDKSARIAGGSASATARTLPFDGVLPAAADVGRRSSADARIDELHLEHPFAGARMLRDMLKLEDIEVGRNTSAR
jgi:hypothetical protein